MAILLISVCTSPPGHAGMVVIGHETLKKMDKVTVGRIYTGRTVQADGMSVHPANLRVGDAKRAAFLTAVLQQSDDDYVAYWIVRRAIGKGVPPPEVDSPEEMISFVQITKGGIGYVDEADLVPGVNVLLLLP